MAQVGDTAATAKSSTVEGGGGGGGGAAGGGASRTDKFLSKKSSGFFPPLSGAAAAAAESTGASSSSSSLAIAAATAAAIAAGPLKLGASASDFEGSGTGAALPLLEMRGCTPIGNKSSRFEINLGQQLAHLSSLEWQVSLMWPAARRVRRASHSPSLLGAAGDGAGVGGVSSGSGSGGGGGVGGGGGSSSNSRRTVSGGGGSSGRGGVAAAAAAPAVKPVLVFRLYTLHTSDAEWLTLGGQREGELVEGEVRVSFVGARDGRMSCIRTFGCY